MRFISNFYKQALIKPWMRSLYKIIEAVENELNESENKLAPSIVMHLIDSGKIKLTCETESCGLLFQ